MGSTKINPLPGGAGVGSFFIFTSAMNSKLKIAILFLLLFPAATAFAQSDRKAAELKNLEKGIAMAEARVALGRKQLAAADSLISLGQQMIKEGKAEVKTIYSDSDKVEKEYAAARKPLEKLIESKDKTEAARARADLKTLDTKYRTDNLSLEKRLKGAERKQASGSSLIARGKTAKLNARDGLKTSTAALKTAQKKYETAEKK